MRGAWIVLLMVPLMVSEGAGECLEGAWGVSGGPGVAQVSRISPEM